MQDFRSEGEMTRTFQEFLDKIIHLKANFQRGFYSSYRSEPHVLPVPFPRFLTPKMFSADGQLLPEEEVKTEKKLEERKDQFTLTVPTAVKLQ